MRTIGEILNVLGMRRVGPVRVLPNQLISCSCVKCRAPVWLAEVVDDGRFHYVDREEFRGMLLLSLHPCLHEWTSEDFNDPDWGWVDLS
jgi:hypothetical protein